MVTFREQLRNNAVSIISLAVALGSLGYNTWRNEHSERNRNVRTAAFEILTKLAEFERVVFLAQYDRDASGGNPRTGWTYVLVISDLSEVVPEPVHARATQLRNIWGQDWEGLGKADEAAVGRIDDSINELRQATLATLHSLR